MISWMFLLGVQFSRQRTAGTGEGYGIVNMRLSIDTDQRRTGIDRSLAPSQPLLPPISGEEVRYSVEASVCKNEI